MPFEAYQTWRRQQENAHIESHLPLVYNLASNLMSRAGAVGLELGDLVQSGVMGLYHAVASFDAGRGTSFGAYAKPFVRGAMLDEIARHRNEPRSVRDKYRRIRAAQDRLMQTLMREPTDMELACEVGIEPKVLAQWLLDVGMREPASLAEVDDAQLTLPADTPVAYQPEAHFLDVENKQQLVDALAQLTLREQQLLHLYYQEELTFKEIGYVLDLSESQVSRTHKKALATLRSLLAEVD